jgi:predicted PhzF superfamily epimerase YddE/YHI9
MAHSYSQLSIMSRTSLPYYLVDAFAPEPFAGNQAGVLVLSSPLPNNLMQKIAA